MFVQMWLITFFFVRKLIVGLDGVISLALIIFHLLPTNSSGNAQEIPPRTPDVRTADWSRVAAPSI